MDLKDALALLHPAIAVVIVFPLIGIVVNRAILVRQRRLVTKAGAKSKIPVVTTASMTFLCLSKVTHWKVVFAVLTSMGLIVIGCQPEVYRLDQQWFISHYYYGVTSAILMIISVAITQDIYKDKSDRWRMAHIILNCLAMLLFIGQGITGSRDLLAIAPSWQQTYLKQCDYVAKNCPQF